MSKEIYEAFALLEGNGPPVPNLMRFIEESNAIEGIYETVVPRDVEVLQAFLAHKLVTVEALVAFVGHFQPDARLRDEVGLNVRVGVHVPPPGGPEILKQLDVIMRNVRISAPMYDVHVAYETLHPFTDGNGRSGRALWAWQAVRGPYPQLQLGFLHAWYYQSLQNARL
jgi:hypothetical protein